MPQTIDPAPDPARGDRIKALRVALALSQKALADMVGVSQRSISNWEKGEPMNRAHLVALAGALHTTLRYITKGGTDRGGRAASPGITSLALERVERRQEAMGALLTDLRDEVTDVREQLAAIQVALEEWVLQQPVGGQARSLEGGPPRRSVPASPPQEDG